MRPMATSNCFVVVNFFFVLHLLSDECNPGSTTIAASSRAVSGLYDVVAVVGEQADQVARVPAV